MKSSVVACLFSTLRNLASEEISSSSHPQVLLDTVTCSRTVPSGSSVFLLSDDSDSSIGSFLPVPMRNSSSACSRTGSSWKTFHSVCSSHFPFSRNLPKSGD